MNILNILDFPIITLANFPNFALGKRKPIPPVQAVPTERPKATNPPAATITTRAPVNHGYPVSVKPDFSKFHTQWKGTFHKREF